jgi:hypothetical protein
MMKNRITATLLCLVIILGAVLLPGCSTTIVKPVKEFDRTGYTAWKLSGTDYVVVAQNDKLELSIKPSTAEVAIKQKDTGKIYYTNPPDRAADPLANGKNQDFLSSQAIFEVADKTNNIFTIDTSTKAVANQQVSFYKLDNGIKVDYLLQDKVEEVHFPKACTQDDFEKVILPVMTGADKVTVTDGYYKVVMADARAEYKDELIKKYPLIKDMAVIYVLSDNVIQIKAKRMDKLFKDKGFTFEQKAAWEAKLGIVQEAVNNWVTLSIDYKLDGDNLVVDAPVSDIKSGTGYTITNMTFLPFFGASLKGNAGYLFIPDGSGAVIDYDDTSVYTGPLYLNFYGDDNTPKKLASSLKALNLSLPVYGIKTGDQAFLGILEEGAPLCDLLINRAGRVNSYNSIGLYYTIHSNEIVDLQALSSEHLIRVYQRKTHQGNYTIRYAFLSGDQANYSGMANYYRDYLVRTGQIKQVASNSQYPLYLDLIGTIDKILPVAGIPARQDVALTSFSQASSILSDLTANGINQRIVRLNGWLKGGINNFVANGVKPSGAMGGLGAMAKLIADCKQSGTGLFLDWNGSYLGQNRDKLFDGFARTRDAAETISREVSWKRMFNLSDGNINYDMSYYVYTPAFKMKLAKSFLSSVAKTKDYPGVALTYEGVDLNSDFKESRLSDRIQSMANDQAIMAMFAARGSVLTSGTNSYALPYTDFIDKVPSTSSMFDMYTYDVPFYQMVIHGLIPYSMESINTSLYDTSYALLQVIETGSIPSFTWIYGDDSLLQHSMFTDKFSVNYKLWMDEAVDIYTRAKAVLEPLVGVSMVEHVRVEPNVYRVTYANGTSIILNYNSEPVQVDSYTVPGQGYWIVNP